jgi:hypothetical protein
MPNPISNVQPEPTLNPQDLFTFLEEHDDFPASGQRLAEEARERGSSPELVQFFEAIPGTLNTHAEVVKHAIKPTEPPYGQTLDLSPDATPAEPFPAPDDLPTLEISDITQE